jgi:subtilisin family serine protease
MTGVISWNNSGDTGHGTHVAGIVAAENNNGVGVCGIAGGSGKGDGVKLMSIQIFKGETSATTSGLVRAMQYAADNGALISQNSWGYTSAEAEGYPSYYLGPGNDKAYKQQLSSEAGAMDYFVKNAGGENSPIDGGLLIFAAGNDTATLPGYPAAYEPCVAVAAMSPSALPAYYTDHGIGTDMMTPGGENIYKNGEILSTIPTKFSESGKPNYGLMQGTSQACPHVSGVAALGLSYAKKLGKRYTAKEFRSMLLSATNDITPYLKGGIALQFSDGSELTLDYPSYKGKLGGGFVDAYKLLLQVEGTPCQVVKVGKQVDVDLSLYFGEGIDYAQFVSAVVSDENSAGLTIGSYADGKFSLKADKVGNATVTVTMLVGGGSLTDNKKPYPTEVVRKFVVISKENTNTNGGWL